MKRPFTIASGMLATILGGVIIWASFRSHAIMVTGQLSNDDLIEIKNTVRAYMVSGDLIPSWKTSFRKVPHELRYWASHRITRVAVQTNGTVQVWFKEPKWRDDTGYELQKGTNGWRITSAFFN